MRQAISLACANVAQGGGPFGAVIVRDGVVVATGVNRVTSLHDTTAHAEVQAIRAAALRLGTHDLSGCELYASCEPCPMCLGAIYWAHLDRVYYAGSTADAARAGFDDSEIYDELRRPAPERRVPAERLLPEEGEAPFEVWRRQPDHQPY